MAASTEANGTSAYAVSAKVLAVAHPLAEEPAEFASNINYHAQFSPHFFPFKFEPEQAYYATADSVRDRLVQVRFLSMFRKLNIMPFSRIAFLFFGVHSGDSIHVIWSSFCDSVWTTYFGGASYLCC